tara:strand:- start:8806 stop:9369 length:564 start_codon:yes stop_codon:yes gene_type:complete
MTIDNNVWMIALLDNPDAGIVRQSALESFEDFDIKVNLFNAITPKDVFSFINLTRKNYHPRFGSPQEFTETERAVWYSHYFLWEKCIETNRPIVIVEEDCLLMERLPKFIGVDKIETFCYNSNRKCTPAAGYYLPVEVAIYLKDYALNKDCMFNVDNLLAKKRKKYPESILRLAVQIERDNKTINHW